MTRTPLPLPIGWPLLPLPDENGELNYPSLEASVRQTIRVILSTRPGEQLMRPRFGAGLDNFAHQPNNLTTRRRIYDLILESLESWEPRILIDRVDVATVEDQPARIRIELAYRIRRTGQPAQLGITINSET